MAILPGVRRCPASVAAILAAGLAVAAPATAGERPRTCLVLSGGGARGAAHVGVLDALETLHVPVDCVVGTSIGAVVGGLYASGTSPAEIRSTFEDTDWRDLFTDRPPRKNIPFRRKQDDNLSLFRFELGFSPKRGFVLPSGLIAGQKLQFLLNTLTLRATGVHDFDHLAIPFRAVATDIDSGEMVVLGHGDLTEALRASMSVPGAFTPTVIDGRTLVDGGLVRNLPVDVARDLGAERIIAVDVTTPVGEEKPSGSVVGITLQTIDVLTDRNVREQRALLGASDTLIRPDLGGIESADFGRIMDAVAEGRAATLARAGDLRRFAVSEDDYRRWQEAADARLAARGGEFRIDEIRVDGVSRVDPRIVTRRMKTRPGTVLDVGLLERDLRRVYELGDFEQVDFRLRRENDRNVLVIEAREKSWGPNFVRFGLQLEADFEGQGEFDVLADLTRTRVNRLGAEVKTLLTLGETNSVFTEFYQPLDFRGTWFVAPQAMVRRTTESLFQPGGDLSEVRLTSGAVQVDFGIQFRRYGELRLGARRGRLGLTTLAGTYVPDRDLVDTGGWDARVVVDQLDNANFPRRGTFLRSELFLSRAALGGEDRYDRLDAELIQAQSVWRHIVVLRALYGTSFDTVLPFYDEFTLGGFLRLTGLRPGELRGQTFGLAQLIYFARVGQLPGALGDGVYVGIGAEAGNVWTRRADASFGDLRPGGLVLAGADTVFGPLYLGYGRTDGGNDAFYLFLGQSF